MPPSVRHHRCRDRRRIRLSAWPWYRRTWQLALDDSELTECPTVRAQDPDDNGRSSCGAPGRRWATEA